MDARSRAAFLILIVAQAAHSLEEYAFRLFDVFAPARFVSGLVSSNLPRGFASINVALVVFGLWSYMSQVRTGHSAARALAWFWTILELANGAGHILLAMSQGAYFPGLGTAPLLFGVALYLAIRLSSASQARAGTAES